MIDQNMQAYRVFYEVAKRGNITHAARQLYISQPAVSSAIANLEASLGTRLFLRKSRGVELTEDGRILFEHVGSAFEILSKGENELIHRKQADVVRLSVGCSIMLCHVIGSFLKDFLEAHPYIELSLINQSSHKTFSMLEHGALDLGITTEPPQGSGVEYFPFMPYDFTFVSTPAYLDNLKLRGAQNTLDYFHLGTLMLLPKKHPKRQIADCFIQKYHIEDGHVMEVSNMDLLIQFTEMSMGIGYVIRNFVTRQLEQGLLVELSLLPEQDNRFFGLSYSSTVPISRPMNVFIDCFKAQYPPLT